MEKKEYDIIKMVQHGKYCERIQDTIFGQTLIYWLKYHPQTAKEELWNLMRKKQRNGTSDSKPDGAEILLKSRNLQAERNL